VLICVCLCLGVALLEQALQSPYAAKAIHTVPDSFDFSKYKISVPKESAGKRTVFPYSVISGGVINPQELKDAVASDPVVAAHYADFDVENARVVRAMDAKMVHVSYRIGNRVYWSAKTIALAQGEQLMTDGKNLARTRCGNRISTVAQEPVLAEEPPPEVFDAPFIPAEPLPLIEMPSPLLNIAEAPVSLPLEMLANPPDLLTLESRFYSSGMVSPRIPTPYFPPLYLREEFPDFPDPVPEPGTFILVGSGIAAAMLIRRRLKNRE
jgi:hypothetical protein